MKTREEVVNSFTARFSSEIGNVWMNGYRHGWEEHGMTHGYEEAYEKGLNDAWETAKALHRVWTFDCYGDANEFDRLLDLDCDPGENVILKFFSKFTAKEAAEKLREHEKQTEIARGDEVEALDTGKWVRFIAWSTQGEYVVGVDEKGGHYEYPLSSCRKTGKHFGISFAEANRP